MLCEKHWSQDRPFRAWTLMLSLNPFYTIELATTGLATEMDVLNFLQGKGNSVAMIHEVGLREIFFHVVSGSPYAASPVVLSD